MAEASMLQSSKWRDGSTSQRSVAQNRDMAGCTIAAAATSFASEVSRGSSIAPAARVASVASPPVASAQTVDGKPLRTVAASHAQNKSLAAAENKKPRRSGAWGGSKDRLIL